MSQYTTTLSFIWSFSLTLLAQRFVLLCYFFVNFVEFILNFKNFPVYVIIKQQFIKCMVSVLTM